MIIVKRIVFFALCLALSAGCAEPAKEKPIWQQVKLSDIAPPEAESLDDQKLMMTDLRVLFFEIPADKVEQLDEIWASLFREPFKFSDEKAFAANSFAVGFGRGALWNELDRCITQAAGVRGPVLSLMLFDGQTEDIQIVPMPDATIFYISSTGSMEGVTVGAGVLSLRLKVEEIPAARGIRRIVAVPAFKQMRGAGLRRPDASGTIGDITFDVAEFQVAMSPGDFFLLGPQRYIADQITLGSAFFSRPGQQPAVRLCIVLCARIDD